MANPLIALMAKMPDVRGAVEENLQNQLLQQGLNQKAAEFQQAQEDRARQQQQLSQNQELFSMAQGAQGILPLIPSETDDQATIQAAQANMQKVLGRRYDEILARGGDPSDTLEAMQMVGQGRFGEVKQLSESLVREAQQRGLIKGSANDTPASLKEFETMIAGLSPDDQLKARRIRLGLDPRAVGSAAMTTAETGKTKTVARSEADIVAAKEAAKETAKLKAQLKLKPEVESAVKSAVAQATLDADAIGEAKSNESTLTLYETAMNGLTEALGGTTTGPGIGWLPAITANAQIAEGAVAAMAPILKQLFRSSGEGTFTDKDQELLLKMVPTRSDLAEARISKLSNIDAMVRAKLKQPQRTSEEKEARLKELRAKAGL